VIPRHVYLSLMSSFTLLGNIFTFQKLNLFFKKQKISYFPPAPSDIFGSMNVQLCASPPPLPPFLLPSPLPHSPSVSLAVCLCSLSMCSAKPVSK